MNGNPYFSDFDPDGTVGLHTHDDSTDIGAVRDTQTAPAAMILDSTAHSMEVSDQNFQRFDDILTGNDATVRAGGAGDAVQKMNPDDLGNDSYIDGLIPDGWQGADLEGAAPQHMDVINGQEVLVIGNPDAYRDFNHQQGDNDLGFKSDCGLCSSQDVLNQFGVPVSENDVVHHAVDNNECYVAPGDGFHSGETTPDWQARVLTDYGVPAHVENGGSMDDLAANIQDGHGVIIEVNAGVLWNDPNSYGDGSANHAITVTGVVRDPTTSEVTGFIVNDSGDGKAEKFVDAATMQQMWGDTGSQSVVTDVTH